LRQLFRLVAQRVESTFTKANILRASQDYKRFMVLD
jgi:hypothetical protein